METRNATGAGMSNADVLKMAAACLGPDVIVGYIRQSPSRSFDLLIDSLIALKKAHIPDGVVAAMQQVSTPSPAAIGSPATPRIPDPQIPTPPEANAFYSVSPSGKLKMLGVGKPDIGSGRSTITEGNQAYYQLFGALIQLFSQFILAIFHQLADSCCPSQ